MPDPKKRPHYINNKEFSLAVVDYVTLANKAKEKEEEIPKVTNYIATCFLKISEGLSHRPNFVRYTYREEMVMDAVENCLRAIRNYKIETATRTGNPNAFSYFTQICFFAFLRRIAKEKKQQEIKFKFIEKMGIEDFTTLGMDEAGAAESMVYIDSLRQRMSNVRAKDTAVDKYKKQEIVKKKKDKQKLELFMR